MIRFLMTMAAVWLSVTAIYGRTIEGEVRAENDSTAIAGASCRLMAGEQFIAGVTTNEDGRFEISTKETEEVRLEISMTGYASAEILIKAGESMNVGTVYLTDGVRLGEVQVTAHSIMEVKGRTVIFPSVADVKASSTSIGLFQKLPLAGLEANPINRTLSVDGGTPVILINGIPSTIEDFNSLQPKDIAKVEYSRITPARYADSGNTGFLNITLKQRSDGGQVYIWGRSAVTTAFVDGSARASYHQGPSQFTLTYNPSWRNYHEVYDNTTESYIGNDFRVNLDEHDRNPFNYHYHNIGLKYDYSPDVNTVFSATFRINPSFNKRRTYAHTIDSYLGDYSNESHMTSDYLAPSLDLFFRRDFNQKNSMEVQVVGTLSDNDYRRVNDYLFSDGSTSDYVMDVDSRRRSLITEINYTHQFCENTSLTAGYQNTLSHSRNTYLATDYKPILTENNNYAYARLGQQLRKVYLSLSSGAKLYWIKNDLNKRHFIRNLTTVQASWNISQQWSLVAAFQYSPSIPSLSALTDYPQQQTPYLVSNGNPRLKVAQNFVYQLMPSFKYKKFSTSLLMNYRNINDFVMADMMYMGNRLFLSQSVNARRCWAAWGNLNMKISDVAGFGANVNLGLDHYETMGAGWSHHLTSFSGSFTAWWTKGPCTISYWRKIPGKYLSGNVVSKEENGDALSFEVKPDKHWTLEASWMYMFDPKGTQYPSWGYSSVNPYYKERYIKHNGNMVVLSASYSVDFGSLFRSSKRSLNNSDNGSSLLQM
ncbi:MAG: carboxypeptidase-like regulatory domain-containing protein [Candidatus Amulumruptor caecigallinarius]|nr:carboxypeptidase-like regulatory domain-containing protein [Candidatus Amulumruptor caecigallinarius]MCM1396326.1 carboxypeptidase-like regulatory domain-containing protein [Candidatus Amulumruptor caecigallinarius]MCM1453732.1 carboxypeptidase-like regulatory domain-containing protein [bacterium]